MDKLNVFQIQFMKAVADIQESCVSGALGRKHDFPSRKEELYALTSEVIYRMMELIDGYGHLDVGKMDIICEKTGKRLKKDPFIELHDVIYDYLKT